MWFARLFVLLHVLKLEFSNTTINLDVQMRYLKPISLWLATLGVIAFALLFFESDMLWKVQQYNLFLFTKLFFTQAMVVPGGFLQYLGTFFTQFFYYPWLGVLLLCVWWLLLIMVTKRTLRLSDQWHVLALLPIVPLMVMIVDLGYWVYAMKMEGYFFMPSIGTTVALAALWGYRKITNAWVRMGIIVLTVLLGYPLLGAYGLASALLMGIMAWRLEGSLVQKGISTIVTLVTIAGIPHIYYQLVYYQTNIINLYVAALPDFTVVDSYPVFKTPYYILLALLVVMTATYGWTWKASPKKKDAGKPWLRWSVQGVMMVAMGACVWHFWYKDDNFHHELRMERCIEQADWAGVLEEGRKQDGEPTRSIVMMHNLALSRLGRQCDEMYSFAKGSHKPNTELPIYLHNTAGRLIYYQYGVLNECHRMCMEQGVNFGWSVELLQYLTRCSLLGDERQATRKYIDLLKETLFYSDWAEHMEKLLNDRELLLRNIETGPVTHMLHHVDQKSSDDCYVERYLMTMLSKTDSDDLYFQEQAVLGAMWTRDAQDFWQRISHYTELPSGDTVPRIFLEAACLFASMEGRSDIIESIDPSIVKSFNAFMNQLQQCQGLKLSQMRKVMLPQFGNTYFYEYYFLKDITYF